MTVKSILLTGEDKYVWLRSAETQAPNRARPGHAGTRPNTTTRADPSRQTVTTPSRPYTRGSAPLTPKYLNNKVSPKEQISTIGCPIRVFKPDTQIRNQSCRYRNGGARFATFAAPGIEYADKAVQVETLMTVNEVRQIRQLQRRRETSGVFGCDERCVRIGAKHNKS